MKSGGEADVPSQCSNGSIWWNYPRGTLVVTFTQSSPFTVCLKPEIGPLLSSVHQAVNGQSVEVKNPQEGEEVCMPHADTMVQVLLEEPPFQTYMTLYDFRINFQE
nr:hypothetical protein BaRGS_018564 [Batillaria attramentaria]